MSMVSLPAGYAGLVNQDTGEVYRPSLDEDGELEEPPGWVMENLNNIVRDDPVTGLDPDPIITEIDLCRAPISDLVWVEEADGEPSPALHEAIDDADLYAELLDDLEIILSQPVLMANYGANVLTDVVKFFPVTIDSFDCNVAGEINSFVTFTIPVKVFGISNGDVVVDGSLQLRQDNAGYDQVCLEVANIETHHVWPFGGVIENYVGDLYRPCI
jgi:hypothetical protein